MLSSYPAPACSLQRNDSRPALFHCLHFLHALLPCYDVRLQTADSLPPLGLFTHLLMLPPERLYPDSCHLLQHVVLSLQVHAHRRLDGDGRSEVLH